MSMVYSQGVWSLKFSRIMCVMKCIIWWRHMPRRTLNGEAGITCIGFAFILTNSYTEHMITNIHTRIIIEFFLFLS